MPFESLSERLQMSIRRITGRAVLNEKDIEDMMKEVRLSLLEADVNYKVVKEFTKQVKEKAMGEKILKSLTPGDMVVKIVHDELKALMGNEAEGISYKMNGMTVVMLVGLQGAGKTTHCGKLASYLRKKDAKKPMLIAADIYRPAAINQLVQVGKQIGVEVFEMGTNYKVTEIVSKGLEYAKSKGYDLVIIDTAGRLHIDEQLMDELNNINSEVNPNEILLVIDSMTGQDAINVIEGFNERLPLTGAVLTKLDGDTRGGAALSIRHLTNVPIKFIGVSEKMDGLDEFYPDRMATRILGMGDIMTMLEKAEEVIDQDEAAKTAKKMQEGKFDLEDFLSAMKQIKKLGPLENILKMLPGIPKEARNIKVDPKDMAHIEAIILSMTPYERRHPECIKNSRKLRISKGCARSVEEINRLIKQFEEMKKMMKQFKNGKMPF